MVEFHGKFGKRINDKIAEYQVNKSRKLLKKMSWTFLIISLVIAIIPLLSGFQEEGDIFLFSLGVFFVVFWAILPAILTKSIKKQQSKIYGEFSIMTETTEEIYKFDEEKVFIFTTLGDKYRSAIETIYGYFSNVFEDDDCYMLFVSSAQCHIIFKDELVKGALEEFEAYLKKYFNGRKYIKNCQNNSEKPENNR